MQETYLRAWRAFHGFENRSSVRTWMYRIATNACLTALEAAAAGRCPPGSGQPSSDPTGDAGDPPEVPGWSRCPTPWSGGGAPTTRRRGGHPGERPAGVRGRAAAPDPAAAGRADPAGRAGLAGQRGRRRRSTLSVAAVNSSLQRARAQLGEARAGRDVRSSRWTTRARSALLEDYVAAFEAYDVDRIVELLTERRGLGDAAVHRLVSGCCGDRPADLDTTARRRPGRHAAGADRGQRPADVRAVHARRRRRATGHSRSSS